MYLPLALAAANSAELITISPVIAPLLWSFLIALISIGVGRLLSGDRDRAALLSLILVLGVGCYGYFGQALASLPALGPLTVTPTKPAIWLLLVLVACLLVTRYRGRLINATRFFSLMGSLLLIMAVTSLSTKAPAFRTDAFVRSSTQTHPPTTVRAARPDIYLIILDKYTGSESLRANYGFDNSEFESELRRSGFFIPQKSRANYVHTFLVLAAMLNWDYLTDLPADASSDNRYLYLGYDLIERNKTSAFLKSFGYRFVFLPTGLPATSRNRDADVQLPLPGTTTSEFEVAWLRTTIIPELARLRCRIRACRIDDFPYTPESASRIDWKFRQLARMANQDEPLFVLAHLLVPHEPYIYNEDCSHRRPYWPARDDGAEEPRVKEAYVAQVKCVNRKVERLVGEILRRSSVPPIIILQADHGHGRLGRDQPSLASAAPEKVRERLDVFAAYHLPGGGATVLYDSISPVNVMRSVLRYYFDAPLEPVEDASYWSAWARPYSFTRIP